MSNSDRNDHRATARTPGDTVNPAACAAEDLKALLGTISHQIADADRRQAEALSSMQARLAALGAEARSVRSRVPAEYMAAFERIEDGVDELAQRIGDASTDKKPAPAEREPAETAAFAPAPLRSAATHDAPAQRAKPHAAAAGAIDPFDFTDSSRDDGEPWDTQSAEALARIYDNGKPGGARMADPEADDLPAAGETDALRALVESSRDAAAPRHGLDVEKAWLEKRFADIAVRVEQSLADIRPDSSFLALGQRFDQFEERFGSVLGDVATRADVEGLRLIEAHINELTGHLEQTQSQLARLDGIEAQLADLIERIADGQPMPAHDAGAGMPDFDHLAETAAERVAQRFAGLQQPAAPAVDPARIAAEAVERFASRMQQQLQPGTAAGVDDLRNMLEDFIAERRNGDEHTSTMLDTMQQAMIRVLDRIDAMEVAQHTSPPRAAPQEYVREQVRFNVDPAQPFSSLPPAHEAMTGASAAAVAAVNAAQKPLSASPFNHAPGADQSNAQSHEPTAARSPVEKKRQDFIDEARRAKQRAAAAAVEENVHVLTDAAVKISAERTKPGKSKPKDAITATNDTPPTVLGYPRQKLLVSAFAMVALIAGTSLLMRKPARAPQPTAAATQTQKPVAAKADAAAPVKATAPAADATPAPAPAAKPAAPATGDKQSSLAPAPQAPVTAAPAEGAPKRLRPIPETGVDDLSFEGHIVGPGEQRAEASDLLPGVAVYQADTDATATVSNLARVRQQQSIATHSSRLGLEAVRATPAALVPDSIAAPATQATAAANSDGSAGRASTNLDLPPVTVGPLSLRLAAAKGDPSAEFEVASRLAEGKGTSQNFKEAHRWYQRAATQGFAQAQYRLGTLFERGLGTKADTERARVWYRRAAEQGNVKAMHNLAVLSAGRVGNSPDYDTAARFFAEAAEMGLADSQFNLAVLHQNGLGVAKDDKQAYKWLSIAARSGDKETIRRRDEVKANLAPADAQAIDQLVATWQARPTDRIANDARAAGELWKTRDNAAASEQSPATE